MGATEKSDAPETVESGDGLSEESEDFRPLVAMLEMVASKKGEVEGAADSWVEEVRGKLEDVGVRELRDVVQHALFLNRRLANNGHRQLHQTTLNLMLREVCEMLVWPAAVTEITEIARRPCSPQSHRMMNTLLRRGPSDVPDLTVSLLLPDLFKKLSASEPDAKYLKKIRESLSKLPKNLQELFVEQLVAAIHSSLLPTF